MIAEPSSEHTDVAEAKQPVLVAARSAGDLRAVLPLADAIATARGAELIILHVERPDSAQIDDEWIESAAARVAGGGTTARVERRSGYHASGAIREAVLELQPSLLVLAWNARTRERSADRSGPSLEWLLSEVPCDTVLLEARSQDPGRGRVLLASAETAGLGLAIEVAVAVAASVQGSLTIERVVRADASPADQDAARAEVAQRVEDDAITVPSTIEVTAARSPAEVIVERADPALFDVLVLNAPEHRILARSIRLNSFTERVSRESALPVLVVRESPRGTRSVARRLWRAATRSLPTLNESQKIETYRGVRRGARSGSDFFIMMGLASAIATFGLLQSSAAVIIGAMLVAPLMLPLLALGLAAAEGDARLLRVAMGSMARGAALAVGVSLLVTHLAPGSIETPEILARAHPTALDLGIAVCAGAAGAYAIGRSAVGAALPGVAIAAALVPPLSVVGIGVGLEDWQLAGAALLLFAVNLLAISAAGGLTFVLLGFSPDPDHAVRLRFFNRALLVSVFAVFVMAVPLVWHTSDSLRSEHLENAVASALDRSVSRVPDLRWQRFEVARTAQRGLDVTVEVARVGPVTPADAAAVEAAMSEALERPVHLTLQVITLSSVKPSAEPTP